MYASALIKKRRYWPRYIQSDAINDHMLQAEVGDVDAWQGTMDLIPFHVFVMKEADYIIMLMSTYGTNNQDKGRHTARMFLNAVGHRVRKSYGRLGGWVVG